MRDNVIQRAWDVIAEVRDRAPRRPVDASTDAIVKALRDARLLAERLAEPDQPSYVGDEQYARNLEIAEGIVEELRANPDAYPEPERPAVDRLMEAVVDPSRRPTEAEHEAAQAEISQADPDLVAAFEAEDVVSEDAVGPSWQHFTEWRGPTPDEAKRMAAVAQRHTVAELRRLADVVPVGPARTILLNEADRIEGAQR